MENSPSTAPIDILPTSDRPDIVFVSKDKKILISIELTVLVYSPDCINVVHEFKFSKYQLLLSDLEIKNYSSRFVAIEIGALGHYLNRTLHSNLYDVLKLNMFAAMRIILHSIVVVLSDSRTSL